MRGSSSARAAGMLVAVLAAVGTTDAAGVEEGPESRPAFTFTDDDITESSGLVARDGLVFTVNDSGGGPVLYAVDADTGQTVAITTYSSGEVVDVEALAPGPGGALWVADIGDNAEERSTIDVYRVVPLAESGQREDALDGEGAVIAEDVTAERYRLAYPDSAHDAEALLVHPDTGRVHVVTKSPTGGTVYAAPASLDPGSVNQLREVGEVQGLVTDGSFFPDGEHVMVRSYGRGNVYTFPELRHLGNVRLPRQRQGEGLAVDEDGRIYLSTEGAYSDVLRFLLPPEVATAMGDLSPATSLPGTLESPPPPAEMEDPTAEELSTGDGAWLWAAVGVLLLTAAGWVLFTVTRRGRRRW